MSQPGPKTGLPIASIKTPYHAKPNPEDVAALAESIRVLGLLCPPTVDHTEGNGYTLIAGRRRLAACYLLGWERMPVHIREQADAYQDPGVAGQRFREQHKDLLRELATLDENLIREHMTPAQRAEATDRRKVIWEQIHPDATAEAKRAEGGKTAGRGRPKGPLESSGANSPSFVNDTASKTGRSAASVRRDAQIGRALAESPEAAAVVHSAPKRIAQSELLAIAQAKPEERKAAAEKAVERAKAPKAKRALHPRVAARSRAKSTTVEATVETPPTAAPVLSDRDQKIHDLYRASRTTKEIAEELGLSVSVVQTTKGRLGLVKRHDNPLHGLIFNVECLASTLLSSAAYVLEEKPATAEYIQEAVAALDKLAAAVARTKAGLLTGTFGEDDDDEDTDDEQEATP